MKNPLPFSLDDVIEQASDSSFKKGVTYYNSGFVGKITRTGNKFEGTIFRTHKYKVAIEIKNNSPYFHCSCPYNYGDICKHKVAFALAILDGKYTGEQKPDEQMTTESFKECFKNAETQKKLDFLKQLLDKDSNLQSQFVAFTKSKTANLDAITRVDISEIKENVFDELSSLDFNYIVENYDFYHDGYYDDGGYIDSAYDAIGDVFQTYTGRAKEFIKKGNLLDAFRIILGMYEGSQNLPDLDNDEYSLFDGGYNDKVQEILIENLDALANEITQIAKSDDSIRQIIDLIAQRVNYFHNPPDESKNEDDQPIKYNLYAFKELFIAMLTNAEVANYLHATIRENNWNRRDMAFVLLKIADTTEDETLWINTAEDFAQFEQEITKQLLEKYKQKNQEDNFNRIAQLAFDKWAYHFDLYLINNLNKEAQKELYLKALRYYVAGKQSINHYKELRNYLTENERKEFVDELGKGFNSIFYIRLLEIEKRHQDILLYAKKQHRNEYHFEEIIAPIANVYPDESYEMIMTKCEYALKSNKNRKTYQQMVKWLKVMQQIESKKTETTQYLKTLYEQRLPALKDEMKKADLC